MYKNNKDYNGYIDLLVIITPLSQLVVYAVFFFAPNPLHYCLNMNGTVRN